jgi:hypothetical protein
MPSTLLWRLYVRMLPREYGLRAELRRIDRIDNPYVAEAKADERESRISEHMYMRDEIEEQLERLKTERLCHRAAKHSTVVIPRVTMSEKYPGTTHHFDKNWEQGRTTGKWYLKPDAYASVCREIEDSEKRRREVWEFRIKLAGTVLPWLVALVSALVSLILAWAWKAR